MPVNTGYLSAWHFGKFLKELRIRIAEMTYFGELCAAMNLLALDERTVFLGQGLFGGTTMSETFKDVPIEKLIEMPVAEEMQTGMAIGMALKGFVPISIVPRWNFMLRAADQIVNHLDRLSLYSDYRPKVIIRTAVPSKHPFNPGPQHDDDFGPAFQLMLRTVDVISLTEAEEIMPFYERVLHSPRSAIMVEFTDRYRNARADQK
jgi:pyruvate/2-oxoglutarate/acetoin dehydrogenase E1 component